MFRSENDVYLCSMTEREIEYDVPAKGSLSLLALGAVGIRAWREKREKRERIEKEEGNAK